MRTKILNILSEVEPNDVIKPLISEIRDLTRKIGDKSSPDLFKYLVTGEQADENLLAMSEALVSVLQKKPHEELDLSGYFLIDWSPKHINWEQANLKEALLLRGSLRQANLKKANLQGVELYEVDLTRTVLEQADISRAFLRKVTLKDAKLNHANLESATLVSTDLRGADLTNANFTDATVDANMEAANLQAAVLFRADLTDANLTDANLTNADLTSCKLIKATLKRANMRSAILKGAEIFAANLTDANLEDANLMGATMVTAILERANLKNANLNKAILNEAHLEHATLAGADLSKAILVRAILKEAKLERANLEKANLRGANLTDANLTDANLANADLRAALLFSIGSKKFQSDLDKGTISVDLQQEFGDAGFGLSHNAVSVKEENRRWLISDKDNKQTYTVRKEERLNICTEGKSDLTEQFVVDSKKFQSDLDKGIISEDLRQEFEDNRIDLSQYTTVSIGEIEDICLISDKDNEQTYTIKKEDGQLKIYKRTKLDPTELFSIDSKKFQSNFDKVIISEDLRQEFENNWIDLSENIAISVKEKGRIWLINDKDNKQTYTVTKEDWLNIYKETKFDFADIKNAKNWRRAIFDDDVRQKFSRQKD